MLSGIDVKQTEKFVSKYDKSEPKTTWEIGMLDYMTFMRISVMADSPDSAVKNSSLREAVKYGLRGVENFSVAFLSARNAKGQVEVHDEFLDRLPPFLMIELSSKIMKISVMSEDEAKNS